MRPLLRLLGRALLVLVALAALAVGAAIFYFRAREAPSPAVTGEVALPRGTRAIELYFPSDHGQGLTLETREIAETEAEDGQGDDLLRTAVRELLAGPRTPEARPAFPAGVELEHVYRDAGGGVYLDFSPGLQTGFRGGSTAEFLLVSAVVRTVAANAPEVTRVTITAGGQPIVTLGGHVRLDRPLLVSEWR